MTEKWVLIVDDGEAVLKTLKECVEGLSPDFRVITTMLVGEAFSHLSEKKFDLVVCDDKLGEMYDLELLDAVHNLQPEAAILLMTAHRIDRSGPANPFMPYPSLPKPVDLEAFKKFISETLGSEPSTKHDFLVLSDERYKQVNQLLARLKSDIGARCIFLTDAEGLVITRIGMVDQIPLEQIASLVAGSVATLLEAGRVIDGESETINLAYREGKHENLSVVNIGKKMLLIIVFGKGPYSSRLGTVWYFAKRTAQTMLGWINTFEDALPGQMFVTDVEKMVDSEFDIIRQDLNTAALPAREIDEIIESQASVSSSSNPFLSEVEPAESFPFWDEKEFDGNDVITNEKPDPME